MQVDLAVKRLRFEHGKAGPTGIDHRDAGFITTRLDTQNQHGQQV
jgi:hypothetical protein